MSTKNFNLVIESLKEDLRDSLISCNIWVKGIGQPIASNGGGNVRVTDLFDKITSSIVKALNTAEFPEMDYYYIFPLEGDKLISIISFDKYLCGILSDSKKRTFRLTA